tara:strand:- start:1584 stop:2837 length:1254 start_codon:yes stop_codon:yes gene_type:complete
MMEIRMIKNLKNQGFFNLPISKKLGSKKAVSIMISYVLLITIAIIMSIIVFSYLRYIANVEPVIDCKDGTSIVLEDYICDKDAGTIILSLRNNGRFNVYGFIPTFGGNVLREPTTRLFYNAQSTLVGFDGVAGGSPPHDPPKFASILEPGEIVSVVFTNKEIKASGGLPELVRFEFVRNLKIQPYSIDEETGTRIPCGSVISRQDIDSCQIKEGEIVPAPIADWKFDGDLLDSTSLGNNLVKPSSKNLPTFVDSIYGQAVEFGLLDGLRCNKLTNDMNDNEVSIGFWAKVDNGALFKRIDPRQDGVQRGFILRGDSTKLEWLVGGLGAGEAYATCEGNFNNWRHIVVTAKTGGEKKIYVDGEFCVKELTGNSIIKSNNNNFYIGTQTGFVGTIDEMKIWKRELTAGQVASLYSSYVN